jgi:hypothetical protein
MTARKTVDRKIAVKPAAATRHVAPTTPDVAPGKIPCLSVSAKTAGFRRAGRAWPAEPVIVPVSDFDDAQLAMLLADPELVVELLDDMPLVEAPALEVAA